MECNILQGVVVCSCNTSTQEEARGWELESSLPHGDSVSKQNYYYIKYFKI
jgi:hypothetical protein